MTITAERLRRILFYWPGTGAFVWRIKTNNQAPAGSQAGYINSLGYRSIQISGKAYLGHRLAWLYVFGHMPPSNIDHMNGNPSDNRIENLRLASQAQNVRNRGKSSNNTSGYKGVTFFKRDAIWVAQIGIGKGNVYLGRYKTAEEAHEAYKQAARRLHGEFARFE